ncbi:hypothetical protein POM88_016623 [Heracleum sosnowskyi]|uniref:Peptidase S8/S53 domain-containing protein n=1 Tax=Heracleum sosnowskyi TaxID=360622 RepID=A0AAD8IMK3_9APIA|nr:hypothetical protein POM88_016623 [Heracleum sosnowskyi]
MPCASGLQLKDKPEAIASHGKQHQKEEINSKSEAVTKEENEYEAVDSNGNLDLGSSSDNVDDIKIEPTKAEEDAFARGLPRLNDLDLPYYRRSFYLTLFALKPLPCLNLFSCITLNCTRSYYISDITATTCSVRLCIRSLRQATLDGVDILTLSIGPDEPPDDTLTFLSIFEIFMLSASKARVFVVQAAGNHGPDLYSVVSYSPWAVGVAASGTDISYFCNLILGNGQRITGVGLSELSADMEEKMNQKLKTILEKIVDENPTLKINVEELCDNSVEEGDKSDGEGAEDADA